MHARTLATGGLRRRPPVRVVASALLVVPVSLALVALAGTPARSAQAGTLVVGPSTGSAATVSTFTTSGVCPAGDTVRVKVFGGSGTGATIPAPTTINAPKNIVGAVDAATFLDAAGTGMDILSSQTWSDFATSGTPVLTRLNGTYTVRAWCSSGDWFDGQVTFTGTAVADATYTVAAATPSPSPTPTRTSSSPSPTRTSTPSPTPTRTSTPTPTPSSSSPTPTPTPTLTPTLTPTPTGSATQPPTGTPSPLPSSTTPVLPGETLGTAVGPGGSFLAPGSRLQAGDNVTVAGSGFAPGELLKYSVFSQEVVFGYGYASPTGTASYRFVVPDLPAGSHKFVIASATQVVVFPFTVASGGSASVSPTATASPSRSGSASAASSDPASTQQLAATGSAPQVLTLGLLALLLLLVGAHFLLPVPRALPAGRHAATPGTPGRRGAPTRGRHA